MDQAFRDLFPAARNYTYLNSAAIGPLPSVTVAATTAQMEDVAAHGSSNLQQWLATRSRVRELIASMLGGRAKDIAFMRNTSDGLCAVAAGLKWKPGDNIVTYASEFPANSYPWRKLRDDHGVELRFCTDLDAAEICGLIDEKTRLVAVSAVQYATGLRVDLEAIGRTVRRHHGLFVVDLIQAFGATPLDLPALYIDVAAGASYKWLCAPEGCGIFYISDRARDRIKPVSRGWTSVARPWDLDDCEQELLTDARAWETGMGGTALLYGLEQSLRLLCEAGIDKIAEYLSGLTDLFCDMVPGGKYQIVSCRSRECRSQIVSIRPLNGLGSTFVAEQLARHKIVVSARGELLRVAPHFFNNQADIERLVAYLP